MESIKFCYEPMVAVRREPPGRIALNPGAQSYTETNVVCYIRRRARARSRPTATMIQSLISYSVKRYSYSKHPETVEYDYVYYPAD